MTYQRIEQPEDLPPLGALNARAREKQDLDFKVFVDKGQMWEHAKDIAAFANALGGVLLIGADNTTDPTLLEYPGVKGQTVADIARIYEQAATMCSPAQTVDVVPLKGPSGVDLVAVNVDPSVHQVVASPGGHKGAGGLLSNVWRFPIRRASLTDEIAPKDLAMHMNQQVRRAYLMLLSIPIGEREQTRLYYRGVVNGQTATQFTGIAIQDVPRNRNFVVIASGTGSCRIPLADVVDVWEESEGRWAVKVTGLLDVAGGSSNITYRPRF